MKKDRDQLDDFQGKVFKLEELVDYQKEAIVSRTLVDKETVTLTVFAFDEAQTLSEHTAPHNAILQALDGTVKVTIGGEEYELHKDETIVMPSDTPHAVEAVTRCKIFLTMIKRL